MKTLYLRFGENFAPEEGTIKAHQKLISKYGFVWYGKFGGAVSDNSINQILSEAEPKILLVKSGTQSRYWAHIESVQKTKPEEKYIPEYYRSQSDKVKCWFKIISIEHAPQDVMSKCIVVSSGTILTVASRVSLNPCLFVDFSE